MGTIHWIRFCAIEIFYEDKAGEEFQQRIELVGVWESGIEGGFYRDLVPFLTQLLGLR